MLGMWRCVIWIRNGFFEKWTLMKRLSNADDVNEGFMTIASLSVLQNLELSNKFVYTILY
jgi:hypothetical protein